VRSLFWLALIILFLVPSPAFSTITYDFVGTVQKVSEPNGLYVNITQSNVAGLGGLTEILLEQPMYELSYYRGQELQFDMLGHDILGRPVCRAYIDGVGIQEAYYCKMHPDQCYHPKWYYARGLPVYYSAYASCMGAYCSYYDPYDYYYQFYYPRY